MRRTTTFLMIFMACVGAAAACDAGPELDFDPTGARPVDLDRTGKADGPARIAVDHLRAGRYPFDDPSIGLCEGEHVAWRVTYRPGALPAGTRVFLHHGLEYMESTWIGDGFCWDSVWGDWRDIAELELQPADGDALVVELKTAAARNLERECQLFPTGLDFEAQYLVGLDFVFRIEHPDGSVTWDTPGGGGFGTFYCEDVESHWEPFGVFP